MSRDFQTFLKGLAIEHHPSTSYYAAGDGMADVNNRKIHQILKDRANEKSVDWDLFPNSTVKLINKSVNCVTEYTPLYLDFGFNPSNALERRFKTATISEGTVIDNRRRRWCSRKSQNRGQRKNKIGKVKVAEYETIKPFGHTI